MMLTVQQCSTCIISKTCDFRWSEKISLSKSALESTWLFHEIGRCHLELENFKESRSFGERSIVAAQEAQDDMWLLNATVLVAQAEVRLKDYEKALESFETALEMAKSQGIYTY